MASLADRIGTSQTRYNGVNYYGQPIVSPEYFNGEHVANPVSAGLPPVCSCGWTRHEVDGQWFELSDHLAEMGNS